MNSNGIYEWTSVGRPLDRAFAANRAVLILMPLSGITVAAVRGFETGINGALVATFLSAAGVALGGWALGRELIPDEPMVAFLALGGSVLALTFVPEASLLLLFATLMLTRIVNRTVGLPARFSDSIAVSAITAWALFDAGTPVIGITAGVAFALDAALAPHSPRQWIFGALWLLASVALLSTSIIGQGNYGLVPAPLVWTLTLVAALFGLRIYRTRPPDSRGDATGTVLSLGRVRAGMFVALSIAVPTVFMTGSAIRHAGLVWVTLAAVSLGRARRGNPLSVDARTLDTLDPDGVGPQ